jgi:hypothetical protein
VTLVARLVRGLRPSNRFQSIGRSGRTLRRSWLPPGGQNVRSGVAVKAPRRSAPVHSRRLAPDYQAQPHQVLYPVQLAPGTEVGDYLAAVTAADSGLRAWDNRGTNDFTVSVVSLSTLLTVGWLARISTQPVRHNISAGRTRPTTHVTSGNSSRGTPGVGWATGQMDLTSHNRADRPTPMFIDQSLATTLPHRRFNINASTDPRPSRAPIVARCQPDRRNQRHHPGRPDRPPASEPPVPPAGSDDVSTADIPVRHEDTW